MILILFLIVLIVYFKCFILYLDYSLRFFIFFMFSVVISCVLFIRVIFFFGLSLIGVSLLDFKI